MLPPPPCPGANSLLKATEMSREGRGGIDVVSFSLTGRELFDDPSYVNIQNLDKARQAGGGAGPQNPSVNGSAPRDLFDMSESLVAPPFIVPSFLLVLSYLASHTESGSWVDIGPALLAISRRP